MSVEARIVTLRERPDLSDLVAGWQHAAFPDTETLAEARRRVAVQRADRGPDQVFVLLEGETPVGTASFAAQDMPSRRDLGPWLASVFVLPEARRRGYAERLIRRVEAAAREAGVARLWLYTPVSAAWYARLGWTAAEAGVEAGHDVTIMRREL